MLPEAYSRAAQLRVPLLALILLVTVGISSSTAQVLHEDIFASATNLLSWPLKAGQAQGAQWRKWQNPYEDGPKRQQRKLLQASATAPAAAITGVMGQPSNTTVYTIVNNNVAEYGPYVCIDACAHGNTCIYQNAWLWQCNGTNPTHHYWVWEPDTLIVRSAATDSFEQDPEICLDMCLDYRYGDGACIVTAIYQSSGALNVGYRECTGASNQQWELQGTQILNKANGYCLAAGVQSCGIWSDCNKGMAQTQQNGMILNVYAEPCKAGDINQAWTLGPAPNSTLIDFTPLDVSAARYPEVNDALAQEAINNAGQGVVSFVATNADNKCMSIEYQTSCATTFTNNVVQNENTTVCVWQNALMQPCFPGGSTASFDQLWIYDNSTGLIVLAADPAQNVCLELCPDQNFANSACSLTDNNVGWQSCTGAPEQKWTLVDGLVMNEAAEMCLSVEPFCLVDYNYLLDNPQASNTIVNGYGPLSSCASQVKNGPWAARPYNATPPDGYIGPIGIQNLVGGPCDQIGNGTLLWEIVAGTKVNSPNDDPIAPGIIKATPSVTPESKSSDIGPIVGGVVGGVVALAAIALGLMYWKNKRDEKRRRLEYDLEPIKEHYYDGTDQTSSRRRKLDSVDSDVLAPARAGALDDKGLGDWEIKPEDIEICKRPDGTDWRLGEGAFGTVYKANRFGVQPVAVKVLKEESKKQLDSFKREIVMLRSLRDNNVVMFLGACVQEGRMMLVTEYLPQGDLWNALNRTNTDKFTWYQRGKKIALDVARGLVHLHSRDIVHMDLKSPNILLGKDLTAKIADVGLARTVSNTSNTMTAIGTMAWAAPELKRNFRIGKQAAQKAVTAKADVFSFGVVLWEIVTGEDPSRSSREVRVPEECPAELDTIIQDSVAEDPDDRPDMRTLYERLKRAAMIPPPGLTSPLPTPGVTPAPTPPMSRDGTSLLGPRSGPRTGGPMSTGRFGNALAGFNGGLRGNRGSAPKSGVPRSDSSLGVPMPSGEPLLPRGDRGDAPKSDMPKSGDSMWADEADGKRGNRGPAPQSERPYSGGLVWSDSAMVNGTPEGDEEGEEVVEDDSDPHGLLKLQNGTHANGDALPVDTPEIHGYTVKAIEEEDGVTAEETDQLKGRGNRGVAPLSEGIPQTTDPLLPSEKDEV